MASWNEDVAEVLRRAADLEAKGFPVFGPNAPHTTTFVDMSGEVPRVVGSVERDAAPAAPAEVIPLRDFVDSPRFALVEDDITHRVESGRQPPYPGCRLVDGEWMYSADWL